MQDPVAAEATYGPIANWDTSAEGIMDSLIYTHCRSLATFNADVTAWDVSGVTFSMNNVFKEASAFNQGIWTWDVSRATTMNQMFAYASVFNQDLGAWDVSSVTIAMDYIFYGALAFNQVLCWDVSKVATALDMFGLSSGSTDPSADKCSCGAGTYYTGAACASCLAG